MGGNAVHGKPFHRFGVTEALSDSVDTHGAGGTEDIIGNLLVEGTPFTYYNTSGWPDFNFWPNRTNLTHSGYYYKWLERALSLIHI